MATRFRKFYESCSEQQKGKIKVVFSDDEQNSYLSNILKKDRIDFVQYNYNCVQENRNLALSNALLKQLEKNKVDYCFSFGSHILKGDILKKYENRLINFHPSLLPMYPGKNAIDQAVLDKKSLLVGNTAHFIDSGIDTGNIIMQSVMTIEAFYKGSYDAILDVQVKMLNKLISAIDDDRLKLIDGKPFIEEADYTAYHIYPNF